MRILLADDSRVVHSFVSEIFSESPYEIEHVYDGSEALSRLKNEPASFDLILLDWEMPSMDGPATLDGLRNIGNHVPVIMVTTKSDLNSIVTALDKGASDYVMKPFTKDIIMAKIETILSKGGSGI